MMEDRRLWMIIGIAFLNIKWLFMLFFNGLNKSKQLQIQFMIEIFIT